MFFVNSDKEPNLEKMKQKPKTIESLVDENDFQKLRNPYCDCDNTTKKLAVKEFFDKVKSESIDLEEGTVCQFERLFSELNIT